MSEWKKEIICERCGKKFEITQNQRGKRYCSLECSRNLNDKFCLNCGKKLTWIKRQRRRNYCSKCCLFRPGNFKKRSPEEIERLKQIGKIGGINNSNKHYKRSKGENYLAKFLLNSGYKIIQSKWDLVMGYEIDIFLPELNVAISYNGPVHRIPIYGQKRLNQVICRDNYRSRKLKEIGIEHIIVEEIKRFNIKRAEEQCKWCIEQLQNKKAIQDGSLSFENKPAA